MLKKYLKIFKKIVIAQTSKNLSCIPYNSIRFTQNTSKINWNSTGFTFIWLKFAQIRHDEKKYYILIKKRVTQWTIKIKIKIKFNVGCSVKNMLVTVNGIINLNFSLMSTHISLDLYDHKVH